jgi:hypothetical protein
MPDDDLAVPLGYRHEDQTASWLWIVRLLAVMLLIDGGTHLIKHLIGRGTSSIMRLIFSMIQGGGLFSGRGAVP